MHSHPTPTFSVITVTYNAAQVLEDTIQSVITQTYHHIEYIIIDGKSTDNTMQIISRYKDKINVVVSEPDKGLYDAMNKGIALATGDYLCFLNAGDSFHGDDTLQHIVYSIKKDVLPDVLYGDTAIVDCHGHFLRMRRLSPPEHLDWRSFRYGMLVCHQSFLPKRVLAVSYDLNYRFSADFDWCIRIMKQAGYMHYTHTTITDYQEEGMTTRNHKASLKERFRIMCRHYGIVSTLLFHIYFVFRHFYKK